MFCSVVVVMKKSHRYFQVQSKHRWSSFPAPQSRLFQVQKNKSGHSSTGVQTKLSSIQVRNEHRSTLYATPPFQLFRKWTWPMLVLTWRAAKFDTSSYSTTGGVLTVFTQVISTEYETSAGAFSKLECSKRGAWDELIDRPALQYSEREVAVCSELIAGLFFSPCITYGKSGVFVHAPWSGFCGEWIRKQKSHFQNNAL